MSGVKATGFGCLTKKKNTHTHYILAWHFNNFHMLNLWFSYYPSPSRFEYSNFPIYLHSYFWMWAMMRSGAPAPKTKGYLYTHNIIHLYIVKIKFQLINIQRHNKTQRKSSLNNFVNCLMTCNQRRKKITQELKGAAR